MRLFIGARLPAEIQKELEKRWSSTSLRSEEVRPIPAANRHLTLAFLGEVPEEKMEAVIALVTKAVERPPKGSFSYIGFKTFPPKGPVLVAAELTRSEGSTWSAFVDKLRDLISVAAPQVDRKPWSPHVTMARAKKTASLEFNQDPFEPFSWQPDRISLILSQPSGDGSHYTDLHVFPFNV